MIDRIAPTRRPPGRVAQRPRWKQLAFLHWRVPIAMLRSLVPSSLEVDTFEGDAFIGLVPFTMAGVRPRFVPPVPGVTKFHETNVRTYVHRNGEDPGVWFFSLDAASRIAATVARRFWFLPYSHARMSITEEPGGALRYRSERLRMGPLPATHDLEVRPVGPVTPAVPDSLEHFLAERYLLYSLDRDGSMRRGAVHHAPYPLQTAEVTRCEETMIAAAGITRGTEAPIGHYASRVDVEIFALETV